MKNLIPYTLLVALFSCSREDVKEAIMPVENPYYTRAFDFRTAGDVDSAFLYFNQAKNLFLENGDSLGAGKCLVNMAIILTNQGDYFGGQETSLEAIHYFNNQDSAHQHYLGTNYNNLGVATFRLSDFDNALKFYGLAVQFSDDSLDTRIYLNNTARAYQQLENYNAALKIYQQLLTDSSKNQREYARAFTNFTVATWLSNPEFDAAKPLMSALHIRKRENDLWGLNSSYAHLADYYTTDQVDTALFYAHERYQVAKQLGSADDQIEGLQKLIELSPPDSAKGYFQNYKALTDSVQLARAAAKNQFALIRYEVEKSKTDNLVLQKENAEKAYQVARQRIWTGSAFALAALLVGGGTLWYRRREQRLALKAENRIKAHQLKTSKKIHDVVANGIYRVMAEIENKDDIDREGILDRLEDMYERSRDISYEQEKTLPLQQPFHEQLSELLKSFATESVKVIIAGNDSEVWGNIESAIRQETKHVLQELMVNMRKHSGATNVVIRFERDEQQLKIHYNDNGKGLPETFQRGNGLMNTGNRIEGLGGEVTFVSKTGKGLRISITIPVS